MTDADRCARCGGSRDDHGPIAMYAHTFEPPREGRCPTCNSPNPALHPAVQHDGEVEICRDSWHGQLPDYAKPREDAGAAERGNAPDLDALQKLCDAATPGPWEADTAQLSDVVDVFEHTSGTGVAFDTGSGADTDEQVAANVRFIAAARTALPALITEVRRLRKLVGE